MYPCDRMLCRMGYDIDNDPMYWLGAALFSGILFSNWSRGIVYLILFLVIYEIMYYGYCRYNTKPHDLQIRIGIVAGAIMGFLIGRSITENDDHEESIREFKKTFRKYFK